MAVDLETKHFFSGFPKEKMRAGVVM